MKVQFRCNSEQKLGKMSTSIVRGGGKHLLLFSKSKLVQLRTKLGENIYFQSNFGATLKKSRENVCFYSESLILVQNQTNLLLLSKCIFGALLNKSGGNYLFLLSKSYFDATPNKSGGKYLLLLSKTNFGASPNKSGGNICSYCQSPILVQHRTKVGEITASIVKVQFWCNTEQKWGK